ncbi:MAG: DUF2336 domain-containing protein [Alphaproteobacteria bacterium]|nr:DUF2336 domain-containing protein [Alphaproteobacteria bacterium]
MVENFLSQRDVQKLLKDPSTDVRADTAGRLAKQFDNTGLSQKEKQIAEEIFRLMVKDTEVLVRETLAQNLKENKDIPHDVAMSLANDVDEVALPIIQFSEVLSTDDLLEIVASQGESKQTAVASREHINEEVSEALVQHAKADNVVATLVANEGAEIADQTFDKVVTQYGDNESVQLPMIHRNFLPVTVVEKLIAKISDDLKKTLLVKHDMSDELAVELLQETREKITISISTHSTEYEVRQLVKQMMEASRLTLSILFRAVCMGDVKFFEYALAEMAGLPITNARTLIHDSGDLGLNGIFQAAQIPVKYCPAFRAAVEVFAELDYDLKEDDLTRYKRKMIERILTQYESMDSGIDDDDLQYLITKLEAM